ncbi:MAG: DUF4337 domain-containing protein [Cytophagaceae bacterium]|nr:DUF4337 domain-containing protein [Cytophagaceae bacterium]
MSEENEDKSSKKLETWCGLLLAVFAAVLAITDLKSGGYGDDQMVAVHEKNSAFVWYHAKDIKRNITQGRKEMLESLVSTGVIPAEKAQGVDSLVKTLDKKIKKYDKEKDEIRKGSAVVGKDNWAQENENNEMGKIIGAEEWRATYDKLDEAGNYFDDATLFLQLCLVIGAISLISPSETAKRNFFYVMIVVGLIGSTFTVYALMLAA